MPQNLTVCVNPAPLMRQLARMAGVPEGRIRRMVLTLDVNEVPTLQVEQFLLTELLENLEDPKPKTSDSPVIVDTTTMQNEQWRTKAVVGK